MIALTDDCDPGCIAGCVDGCPVSFGRMKATGMGFCSRMGFSPDNGGLLTHWAAASG